MRKQKNKNNFRILQWIMASLLIGLSFISYGQTIPEVEPNNTLANTVANGQDRIYQPTTLTGTVSSGDDDYFLIGYDFSLNFGGDDRWWLYFDGDIPAGLTVERGLLSSVPTDVYEGTEGSFTAPFSECSGFEYTSSFTSIYTYLRIKSSDGGTHNYSIGIVERSATQDACFGAVDPREDVIVPCTTPAASTALTAVSNGHNSVSLTSFGAVTDADGYLVQFSENTTFDAIPSGYDAATSASISTTYSGSGNQMVANVSTPGNVTVTGLTVGQTYYYKVTPYNHCLSYYNMGTGATASVTTTKTSIVNGDVTFNPPASLIYSNTAKTYTATSNHGSVPTGDLELSYSGRNSTVYSSTTAPTAAGDYTVTATVAASNTNYGGSVSQDFVIAPFATTISLNLSGMPPVYSGSPQGISPTANDLDSNPTLTLVTEYSVQSANSFSTTAPTDAGTYDVRANLDASETNYTATEATGTYTIDPEAQIITFNSIPEVACGQTTIDLSMYASSDAGNTLTFSSGNLSVATVAGNIATIVGAGTSMITASQSGGGNLAAATPVDQTLTVAASQVNFSVDNPMNVLICDGSAYTLPALTTGNYFSGSGGTGTAYTAGENISSSMTMYVYGVSAENASCTDENSFDISINTLAVDDLADVNQATPYTLPALTNGTYYTGTGGTGSMLNAGEDITSTQTIYIYNTDAGTGCTRESSFIVAISSDVALHFHGPTSGGHDYISVADDNSLDLTNSFTLEAWVNFDQVTVSTPGYGWRAFFTKDSYFNSYGLMVYAPAGGSRVLRFYHEGLTTAFTDYTWSTINPNTWYHIAATYDGSKTTIYVDGVEVSSGSVTGNVTQNNSNLNIGFSQTGAYPFDGPMDEVRVWNYSRTGTEINANKDYELSGNESGLVLYYNFSEGTAEADNTGVTQVTDLSTAGNHGSFNGFALTGTSGNYVSGSGGIADRQSQAVTFSPIADVNVGDPDFTLTASASSGLGVNFTSLDPAVATVSGNTVTIVGGGTATIRATQAGDATYFSAFADQSFTVATLATSINLNIPGTNPTYTGVGQAGVTATADDMGGNPTLAITIEFSPLSANTFSTTLPVNVGAYDVRANIAASETSYTAPEVTGTFTIDKAQLTVKAKDISRQYAAANPTITEFEYFGFQNSEAAEGSTDISGLTGASGAATGTIAASADATANGGTTHGITVDASALTSANYSFTSDNSGILTISKANQTITITTASSHNLVEVSSIVMSATGGASGNPVTFSLSGGSADLTLEPDGVTLTINTAGSRFVFANQAGNDNYESGSSFIALSISEDYIWDGAAWNSGSAPPANKDILFQGNYTLTGSMVAENVILDFSTTLTIQDGGVMTVNADMDNTVGTVIVESGGSLITLGDVEGSNYQIQKTTTFDTNTGRYSIVGSPIENANFSVLGPNALVYGYDQSELYNPSGNVGLDRFKTPATLGITELAVGKGYFSAFTGDAGGAVTFTGTPNTGTINVALDFTDHAAAEETNFEGFNLVSNPYPSAIDFTTFMTVNNANISGSIYLWDDNNSNAARGDNADYVIVNAMGNTDSRSGGLAKWDGSIRSGQGFFVKALAATSINFTNTMRGATNNDGGFFRRADETTSIKLMLSDQESARATVIGFASDATEGTDRNYDAISLSGGALQLYSLQADNKNKLAIQGLPSGYQQEINLGFKTPVTGSYTISIDNISELQNMEVVLLKDHLTGKTVNLKDEGYSFTTQASNNESRFSLQLAPSVISSVDELEENVFYTYSTQGKLNVVFETTDFEKAGFKLIDMTGKTVYEQSTEIRSNRWQMNTSSFPQSIYILMISTDNRVWKKRVVTK